MKRGISTVMTSKKKKRGVVLISAALIVCILSGTLISCGLKKQKQGDNNETQTETDSLSYERLSELADEDTLYLVVKAFLEGDSQTIIDNTWAFGTVQYDIDARTKELKEKYDEFFDSFNISRFRCIETEIESPTSGYLGMWDGKCLKLSSFISGGTFMFPVGMSPMERCRFQSREKTCGHLNWKTGSVNTTLPCYQRFTL